MRKKIFTAIAVFAAILFLRPTLSTATTVVDYPVGTKANGVVSSRHNMGAFGRVITTQNTTQVCVFCHTPHHAENPNSSPLWNRDLSNSTNYTAYGTTLAQTTVNDSDLGGATLACLSCHDGATTFDSLVNAPGNGGVTPGGTSQGWTFQMPRAAFGGFTSPGHFNYFGRPGEGAPNPVCVGCHGTSPGFATSDVATRLSLGFDLANDHPVSIPYTATSKASLRPLTTVIADIDLTTGLSTVAGETAAFFNDNMKQNRWAISGQISSTATIAALLRNNKVECSSCHDPHFRNLSYDEADSTYLYANKLTPPAVAQMWCGTGPTGGEDCSDGLFLRRVGGNTGSGVCRTCHDK